MKNTTQQMYLGANFRSYSFKRQMQPGRGSFQQQQLHRETTKTCKRTLSGSISVSDANVGASLGYVGDLCRGIIEDTELTRADLRYHFVEQFRKDMKDMKYREYHDRDVLTTTECVALAPGLILSNRTLRRPLIISNDCVGNECRSSTVTQKVKFVNMQKI